MIYLLPLLTLLLWLPAYLLAVVAMTIFAIVEAPCSIFIQIFPNALEQRAAWMITKKLFGIVKLEMFL